MGGSGSGWRLESDLKERPMETEDDLKSILEQSWALDEDLAALMGALPAPITRREAIVRGMSTTSHSHYQSQRILMDVGATPTVLALVRLHYESAVRTLWYAVGATEDWIESEARKLEGKW